MKKIFIILFGFLIGIIIFMPKENLYFKALEILDKKNINVISKTKETPLFLEIEDAKIFYLKMPSANVKKITILPLIFFNKIEAKNIKLNIGNYKITSLEITYIPFLKAKIKGKANFGDFEGYASFKEVKIYFKNPKKDIKNFLKRDKKGYFYYERF